jgi:hypothetical protein
MGVVMIYIIEIFVKYPGGPTRITVTDIILHNNSNFDQAGLRGRPLGVTGCACVWVWCAIILSSTFYYRSSSGSSQVAVSFLYCGHRYHDVSVPEAKRFPYTYITFSV